MGSPGGGAAAVVAGVGLATGTYRATAQLGKLREVATQDIARENLRDHEAYWQRLRHKLRSDRDDRTGASLEQLHLAFRRIEAFDQPARARDRHGRWDEVRAQVTVLYRSTLDAMERSWQLWDLAGRLHDRAIRDKMLGARDEVMAEVEQSVQRLHLALDQCEAASATQGAESQETVTRLSELRDELEVGLEVARNVDRRISEMEVEIGHDRQRE